MTLVGEVLDEVAFEVERGKIREFTRATFTEDPMHTNVDAARAAGFDDVLATPPTWSSPGTTATSAVSSKSSAWQSNASWSAR